jgi:hypothetical protein
MQRRNAEMAAAASARIIAALAPGTVEWRSGCDKYVLIERAHRHAKIQTGGENDR